MLCMYLRPNETLGPTDRSSDAHIYCFRMAKKRAAYKDSHVATTSRQVQRRLPMDRRNNDQIGGPDAADAVQPDLASLQALTVAGAVARAVSGQRTALRLRTCFEFRTERPSDTCQRRTGDSLAVQLDTMCYAEGRERRPPARFCDAAQPAAANAQLEELQPAAVDTTSRSLTAGCDMVGATTHYPVSCIASSNTQKRTWGNQCFHAMQAQCQRALQHSESSHSR
jgi:hypothetical protein